MKFPVAEILTTRHTPQPGYGYHLLSQRKIVGSDICLKSIPVTLFGSYLWLNIPVHMDTIDLFRAGYPRSEADRSKYPSFVAIPFRWRRNEEPRRHLYCIRNTDIIIPIPRKSMTVSVIRHKYLLPPSAAGGISGHWILIIFRFPIGSSDDNRDE